MITKMELAPFSPYVCKPTNETRQAIARQVMDPTDATTDQIIEGFIQIIAMEGPTLSSRLFTLYAKKGGIVKLTSHAAKRFFQALRKATLAGKISMELDIDVKGAAALLWLPSMKRVQLREYGNRGFDDIPASELGEVMFELAAETTDEKHQLYLNIAEFYGLSHLPKNAETRLDAVYKAYLG